MPFSDVHGVTLLDRSNKGTKYLVIALLLKGSKRAVSIRFVRESEFDKVQELQPLLASRLGLSAVEGKSAWLFMR